MTELQKRYGGTGEFTILAFPSNDFRQEKGSNEDIDEFVKTHFPEATFPIFGKTSLEGSAVYDALRTHQGVVGRVKGNFFKYLVGRDGVAVRLYGKKEPPLSFEDDIRSLIQGTL